ncbi:protein LAX PANICLE 2-like isoform X1 [Zingiber officinale]|uniref:protein LAX PANICLE 2-like isoform X1 n=1 Tax=Zingiber officinale TaxID=94328 RepID=UPI001C4CA0BD|nr:protein LAX PANICLE 2-like isoform X1 [Zingiber officinale]
MDQEDPSPTILFHEEEGEEEEEEEQKKDDDTTVVSRDWLKLGQAASPSSDGSIGLRVVSPPRRPQSGVWLRLQPAPNQTGIREVCLPQIANKYLRIKDGRLTVRLLMKYLVKKLGLEHESEVEITCRDRKLLPFFTLQYVRDTIWSSSNAMVMIPDSPRSSVDHVMTLQYRRSSQPYLGQAHVIRHFFLR